MGEYEVSIKFLYSFINIIHHITTKINAGNPFVGNTNGSGLPTIISRARGFKYVMLGRLTQDALENLFSVIRSRRSVPDAREFRSVLGLACLSQFEYSINKHGSYAISDHTHLVRYCQSISDIPPVVEDKWTNP
jgi:hypothetical protein